MYSPADPVGARILAMDVQTEIEIHVPIEEIRGVQSLLPLISHYETGEFGFVWLISRPRHRSWTVTDGGKIATLSFAVGVDEPEFEVGLSPLAVDFAANSQLLSSDVQILITGNSVSMGGLDGSCRTSPCTFQRPAFESVIPAADGIGASATVSVRQMQSMMYAALQPRSKESEGRSHAVAVVHILDGEVGCWVPDRERGPSLTRIAADDVEGDLEVSVDPAQLLSALKLFQFEDEVWFGIPVYENEPLVFRSGSLTVGVRPLISDRKRITEEVESTVKEVCGPLATEQDQDGDYPLDRTGAPIFARLLFEPAPATVQVFAVLLTDIEASPDLLRELNDLNASMTYARIFHTDGAVMAEVDLLAETLDESELRTAIERIGSEARRLMPTLALVFGGETIEEQLSGRLAAYRSTIVEAELFPGRMMALNGPDAIDVWPFDGPVHIITGWNPQGVSISESRANFINSRIALDVIEHGGKFVAAVGRSASGDHAEASLAIWGVARADALLFGGRASQDSIFEIDADEVRLLGCIDRSVTAWPRRQLL